MIETVSRNVNVEGVMDGGGRSESKCQFEGEMGSGGSELVEVNE